jgi:hypothetical protein
MKMKFIYLAALASGLSTAVTMAQSNPPVLTNSIIAIQVTNGALGGFTVTNGGTGYTVAPTVVLMGGGGSGAIATANISGGAVVSITVNNPGAGYITSPVVTFSGGGSGTPAPTGAAATAFLNLSGDFEAPFQNEVYGPAGDQIIIVSLAVGTEPASGFIYKLTVDGQSIGETSPAAPPGTPAGGPYVPPLPGVYNITSTTDDGNGNTAVSAVIRYFATGTAIVSPEAGGNGTMGPGTLVPVGSSTVIQATSTPGDGFVQRIDFYTDWNGTSGTFIGSSFDYPYSVIYTPAGPAGVHHIVKAIAYDNTGAVVPASSTMDQVIFTMTTPNPTSLPTCSIVTPATASLIQIPNYAQIATASIPIIVTAGSRTALISMVQLYINGVLFATDSVYPYNFSWQPQVTGTYNLVALAYDNLGNVVASTTNVIPTQTPAPTTVTIEALPAVAVVSPGNGATVNSGASAEITAVATDTDLDATGHPATIVKVQFFVNGTFVGDASGPTPDNRYTVAFTPQQNIVNGIVEPSDIEAIATDSLGYSGTSANVEVTVTAGGTGSNTLIGIPPTVSLSAPLARATVVVNTPVTLAATATAPNGNVASISFKVDNTVLTTVASYPYSTTWTPTNLGTYTVSAEVTDNLADQISTAPITVTVVAEPLPVVNLTSPASGGVITVGTPVTITASATSPDGTISQVQFFVNGVSIGTTTKSPFTVSWTPQSPGTYQLTAITTDNANQTTTSSPIDVEAEPVNTGVGSVVYFGNYQGLSETGVFAFVSNDGTTGTFIGFLTTPSGSPITYLPDVTLNSGGAFDTSSISGTASSTGVSGSLAPSGDVFIGGVPPTTSFAVSSGYFTGDLGGVPGSNVAAIVGADGSIMVYVSNGSFSDAGVGISGTVDSRGAFTIPTVGGNTITGTVDPVTSLLTASLSGPNGGTIIGGKVTGGTFSDGVLKNISTRGSVGSGANAMVAGFVVAGTAPKQLLVRAAGPTLTALGISGAVAGTQLTVMNSGGAVLAANAGWSSTSANQSVVTAADTKVGAFAFPLGSADSAIVGSFAPGAYTATVTGAGGDTGIGLVEVWDMDTPAPFTANKLVDVATRGDVGTGGAVLIAGFIIDGTAPKRLLIRGDGPGLGGFGVSGFLATPHLQLYSGSTVIRENYSWGQGNDPGLIAKAQAEAGAFAFKPGSADSAILIVLNPGSYTVEISGANGATGNSMVEVYEVSSAP